MERRAARVCNFGGLQGPSRSVRAEKEAARASRCYDALDIRLAGQSATLHLGTIAAVASLGYADWRHPDDDWRQGRDGLKAWFEEMMQNPAVAETKPIF